MGNTGYKRFSTIEEYYLDDNSATGASKVNDINDVDYIAPVYDPSSCTPETRYYNQTRTASATKNDCGPGYGGTTVVMTAMAGQFFSSVSLDDANAKADAWLADNKQAYANLTATCRVVVATRIWVGFRSQETAYFFSEDIVSQGLAGTPTANSILVYSEEAITDDIFLYTDSSLNTKFLLDGVITDGTYMYFVRSNPASKIQKLNGNSSEGEFVGGNINTMYSFDFNYFEEENTSGAACVRDGVIVWGFSNLGILNVGTSQYLTMIDSSLPNQYLSRANNWYNYSYGSGLIESGSCLTDLNVEVAAYFDGMNGHVETYTSGGINVNTNLSIYMLFRGLTTGQTGYVEGVIETGHSNGYGVLDLTQFGFQPGENVTIQLYGHYPTNDGTYFFKIIYI